jgi:hypothetical protein
MKDEKYPTYEDERSGKRLRRRRIEKENYKEPQIEEKKRRQKDKILNEEEDEEKEEENEYVDHYEEKDERT